MINANNMMSVEDVVEILSVPLLGVIPEDGEVIVSTNNGEPMVLSPQPSVAGVAFANVGKRLEGEKVPFLDIRNLNDNFMSRLKKFLNTLNA